MTFGNFYSIKTFASCDTQASVSSTPPVIEEHKRRSDCMHLGYITKRNHKRTKTNICVSQSQTPSSPIRLHGPFPGHYDQSSSSPYTQPSKRGRYE
mmetsp:Transcript_2775/g.4938  ORF Transcript_2775/g.4938 Transcript_2775/m.4938 type:complete len:96 (-) Transcript_2775:308-595(-)